MSQIIEQYFDKETIIDSYLDAIRGLENMKFDFDNDDMLNGFGAIRKQFGSDLLTPAIRRVGLIITPVVERIEKCIKDVFTRIHEYTVIIRRSHASLVSSLNLLISEKSQQEVVDNNFSNSIGEDLAEETTDILDATSSSDKNAVVFEILKTKRSSQNDGRNCHKKTTFKASNNCEVPARFAETDDSESGDSDGSVWIPPSARQKGNLGSGRKLNVQKGNNFQQVNKVKQQKPKYGSDGHIARIIRGRYSLDSAKLAMCSQRIIDDICRLHRNTNYKSETLDSFKMFYHKNFDQKKLDVIQNKLDEKSIPSSFLDRHFKRIFNV